MTSQRPVFQQYQKSNIFCSSCWKKDTFLNQSHTNVLLVYSCTCVFIPLCIAGTVQHFKKEIIQPRDVLKGLDNKNAFEYFAHLLFSKGTHRTFIQSNYLCFTKSIIEWGVFNNKTFWSLGNAYFEN